MRRDAISNPPGSTKGWIGTPGDYSTDFEHNVDGKVEHFDVYGEVQTKYSQVYWTRNAPIALPPELVKRFSGKTMAITGYEIDQVVHTGPEVSVGAAGVLGGFSCYPSPCGHDDSVPIYNACSAPLDRMQGPSASHFPCLDALALVTLPL